jgi:Calcineurin-like phosphoesterase
VRKVAEAFLGPPLVQSAALSLGYVTEAANEGGTLLFVWKRHYRPRGRLTAMRASGCFGRIPTASFTSALQSSTIHEIFCEEILMKPADKMDSRDVLVYQMMRGKTAPGALESADEADDVRPASLEEVKSLYKRFEDDPLAVTETLQKYMDPKLTPSKVRSALETTRALLEQPETGMNYLNAETAHLESAQPLPDDFVTNYVNQKYRDNMIPLRPYEHRFEDDHPLGIAGWMIWNGIPAMKQLGKPKLLSHAGSRTEFVYELEAKPERTLRVALFADFGTGLSHSLYIAHQFNVENYDAAIHLGDVYYTGTITQYREYFLEPLAPMLRKKQTKLFFLCDNHEAYSGFSGYLDCLKKLRANYPDNQMQEGSYFCLRTPHAQFIGVDSIWEKSGRLPQGVAAWLKKQLERGRSNKIANIVMTGHEPYEFGKTEMKPLMTEDLRDFIYANHVDMWFWGNTHYCALFDRSVNTPFIGSCIGHGGYPYSRLEPNSIQPAPVAWAEFAPRYGDTGVRSDRGNNGYCVFEFEPDGNTTLRYIDWKGIDRFKVQLLRVQGQQNLSLGPIVS